MKKTILFAFVTLFVTGHLAMASPADPCTGEQQSIWENAWRVEINSKATKEDLLKTLDLVFTWGFYLHTISSSKQSKHERTFYLSFKPSDYAHSEDRGEKVKNDTLKQLASIKVNSLHCGYY